MISLEDSQSISAGRTRSEARYAHTHPVTMPRFPILNWRFYWQRFLQASVCLCLGGLLWWLTWTDSALAQSELSPSNLANTIPAATEVSAASGASLFSAQCAACHAHGGNIIRRGKNLKRRAMARNGYGEVGAIATLITQGKGAMPAYEDRLAVGEIDAIAQFVHDKSETGW